MELDVLKKIMGWYSPLKKETLKGMKPFKVRNTL
jgi:hypothetical protein